MRLLTYLELSRYTRSELHETLRELLVLVDELPYSSLAHKNAWLNIRHLRLFLQRHDYRLRTHP